MSLILSSGEDQGKLFAWIIFFPLGWRRLVIWFLFLSSLAAGLAGLAVLGQKIRAAALFLNS